NSPTLCQLYVAWALQPLRTKYPNFLIYHYMDDILIAKRTTITAEEKQTVFTTLQQRGLVIAPEKLQEQPPWRYLGWLITDAQIRPQKIHLNTTIATLRDTQTLLGDLQWVRPIAGITNDKLSPLLPWLKGTTANEPRTVTEEQHHALQAISEKLQCVWVSRRDESLPLSLWVVNTEQHPFAILCQWQSRKTGEELRLLEWLFLPLQPKVSILSRSEALGCLIRRGRDRATVIAGEDLATISIPVRSEDLEWQLRHSLPLQEAPLDFGGVVHNQQPKGKVWQVLKGQQWIEKPWASTTPVEGRTIFTDAGRKSCTAACVWKENDKWKTHLIKGDQKDSLQTLELAAICWAFQQCAKEPLNVVTDSLYAAGVAQRIEDALLKQVANCRLNMLFQTLCRTLNQRSSPYCVIHIRNHLWDQGL
ncbi:PO113 protein, partial [Menura novaehollandiae]|nr:PO113 protein [Menura novaehollandiae]